MKTTQNDEFMKILIPSRNHAECLAIAPGFRYGTLLHLRNSSASKRGFKSIWPPLVVAFAVTGCLSRPALVHQTFGLHATTTAQNTNGTGQGVLSVRSVQISPMFEGRAFVYRVGPDLYEVDPYAGFIVPPGRALAIPMRTCLRSSGVFADVIDPGSGLEANSFLEVHAQELYGDFRKAGSPAAVLSLRFLLFDSGTGQEQKLVMRKDYTRRVQLKEQTAAALAAGWNQALTEIMTEATSDISSARMKTATTR